MRENAYKQKYSFLNGDWQKAASRLHIALSSGLCARLPNVEKQRTTWDNTIFEMDLYQTREHKEAKETETTQYFEITLY